MIVERLNYGDTIGIIAPASGEEYDNIEKHIILLESLGFKVKRGHSLYSKHGYLAGTDDARVKDLMDMFTDNEVHMIMCYRGGYGTMRILPMIDFGTIRKNPKIFIGYSDITSLLNSIYTRCGFITFHGPMAGSNLEDEDTLNSLVNTLMRGHKPYCIQNPAEEPLEFHGSHSAEGTLVGGNLSLICSTMSTPYEINFTDKILFIEDVGEEPYKVDRMLTQLLLSGKINSCHGFILGQFTNCEPPGPGKSLSLSEVIHDRLLTLNKPVILNLMSGHDYPKLTLPIGARVRIDCINRNIQVLEPVVM